MSELLKGNFMVKNKVEINEENEDVDSMNQTFSSKVVNNTVVTISAFNVKAYIIFPPSAFKFA